MYSIDVNKQSYSVTYAIMGRNIKLLYNHRSTVRIVITWHPNTSRSSHNDGKLTCGQTWGFFCTQGQSDGPCGYPVSASTAILVPFGRPHISDDNVNISSSGVG